VMLVDRSRRGKKSQDRASVAKTIDTDVGHTSHGPHGSLHGARLHQIVQGMSNQTGINTTPAPI
jgi:hypothetical protein